MPLLAPKAFGYYYGRANLRDKTGQTAKRMITNAADEAGPQWMRKFETLKQASGLRPGTPEQRRVGYNMRLNATIPFAIMDEMGQPAMQPSVDPNTGQVTVDEKGQPMMQPVVEQRPKWQVLKDVFPRDYLRQAKDAVQLGAQVPAFVRYDVQESGGY